MMAIKTETKKKVQLCKPPEYGIVFFNNDKTTFQFVMFLLQTVFHYNEQESHEITTLIHKNDKVIVYTSSFEVCCLKNDMIKNIKLQNNEQYFQHEVVKVDGENE
jgi:ATP-dependent Clp protease adapter protein ClpS